MKKLKVALLITGITCFGFGVVNIFTFNSTKEKIIKETETVESDSCSDLRLGIIEPLTTQREWLSNPTTTETTEIEEAITETETELRIDENDTETEDETAYVIEETSAEDYSRYGGQVLNSRVGTIEGPSGKETYYNLPMSGVVSIMRNAGFSEDEYPYWVREDGCKMLGDYIMVAADLSIRPRGSLIECSLGMAIVCDTGSFIYSNPYQLDIATTW